MKHRPKIFAFVARSIQARSTRRAYSLIEMSAAITLSALLLMVVVTVLIEFDRQDNHMGLRSRRTSDLTRLADQFRADVHSAATVVVPQDGGPTGVVVICQLPDGTRVEYRQMNQHLVRITTDPQGEERQERFLFSPETVFAMERIAPAIAAGSPPEPSEAERGQLVKLIARWPINGQKYDAFRQLPITAQIGRDLPMRLVKAEAGDATP
jgi:prepilin-type N-terminal cleavage/methylation domain-containing protein